MLHELMAWPRFWCSCPFMC